MDPTDQGGETYDQFNSITARKTLFLEVMNTFTVFVFVLFFFLGEGGQNKTLKF